MNRRPISVIAIACLYIVAGAAGVIYHFHDFNPRHPLESEVILALLVRLAAIVCGVYLLRGANWARWLAIVWIAYHVVLSGFHSWFELAIHSLLCIVIAYVLFRPAANAYFHAARRAG